LRPCFISQQLQQGLSPEPALQELLSLADTLNAPSVLTGLELADAAESAEAGTVSL
jgi:chemosensory pili system protein ChpA (sensor histidine kinase/response regulator)